jgi:hypothetical protein
LMYHCVFVLLCWCIVMLVYCCVGVLLCRCIVMLVYCCVVVLLCCCVVVLSCAFVIFATAGLLNQILSFAVKVQPYWSSYPWGLIV